MGQARKSLWIETGVIYITPPSVPGQARKSLWIETHSPRLSYRSRYGQARKSLWIETSAHLKKGINVKVRLVRACGSKQKR